MTRLKNKIIKGIQNMEDEQLLQAVYQLVIGIQEEPPKVELNAAQKAKILAAQNDTIAGRVFTTSEIFDELENA